MTLSVWLALLFSSLAISVSPGPGAFAAMSAGYRNGFARGYWVVIGLQLGIVVLLLAVAAGIGALVVASPLAFELVRWTGVAYLAWLGLMQWRSGIAPNLAAADDGLQSWHALLLRGALVNTTNPKGLLFMLAVVPQFLDSTLPLPRQYLILTLTMLTIDMAVMAGYVALAARLLAFLRDSRHVRIANTIFGTLFIVAAIVLALFRSR
jgi:homoserine/homoserine lactone efflux protein